MVHRLRMTAVEKKACSTWHSRGIRTDGIKVEICDKNLKFHLMGSLLFLFLKSRRCGVGSLKREERSEITVMENERADI